MLSWGYVISGVYCTKIKMCYKKILIKKEKYVTWEFLQKKKKRGCSCEFFVQKEARTFYFRKTCVFRVEKF
jgi:hypothetical protein